MANQQEPPKIEFPCENYPIKVVGRCMLGYDAIVLEVVRRHCPDVDVNKAVGKDSAKGTFRSLTVYITAEGKEHLSLLHKDLIALDCVKTVF